MNRHAALNTFLIIFFLFTSMGSICSAEKIPDRPDIIVKISRLNQAINAIDKMAGTDIDNPTSSPSYMLRSILFGTDWIDPNRAIVIGMDFNKMQADEEPTITALVPFIRKNEDFHLSYNAVSKINYYLVPLPPGKELAITDQMHYNLAEAARTRPEGIISIELAASQLLKKADQKIQNMLLELDSKLENQTNNATNNATDLTSDDINNFLKNLIDAAKQLEMLSIGMDITDSDLIFYSDALALKGTDLSKLFTKNADSRTSCMGKYNPQHQINLKSTSYDLKGIIEFFNSVFGEFYKKIGLDLSDIATMASHFTGEVAGGMSFNDSGPDMDMDIEMIAVLNQTKKSGPGFLASVYFPWMMDYGRKMAAFYNQQTPGKPIKNIFTKKPESTVLDHKVFGLNCEMPIIMPDSSVSNKIEFNLRTTEVNGLLLTASSDERLKKLIKIADTLEKQPYDGPLMKMDINLGAYLGAVQKMVSQAGTGMELNLSDMGSLVYTLDITKRKLSNKYVIRIDDIKSMVSAFKKVSADSMGAQTDGLYTADPSFSQSAPTILQDSDKEQMPKPGKEDPAEFWLDKGLLYATYGNDNEAIKFYKQALQINPNNPRALFNMGLSYSSLGNYNMAITALNQALSMAPDNGDYHYGIGWVYLLKGESGKAMKYIRTAADLGNPDARKYLQNR